MPLVGPFRSPELDLAAYVIDIAPVGSRAAEPAPASPRVCALLPLDDEQLSRFEQDWADLCRDMLVGARALFLHAEQINVWRARMEWSGSDWTIDPAPVTTPDAVIEEPAVLIQRVLATLPHSSDGSLESGTIGLVPPDVQILGVSAPEGETFPDEMLEMARERIPLEASLREAGQLAARQRWALAFRAYLFTTARPLPADELRREAIDVGLDLVRAFLDADESDYCEWIADRVADLAASLGDRITEATARWYAGIADEGLGRWRDALDHYERALAALPPEVSGRTRARIEMSYGVTTAVMLCHRETRGMHQDPLDATTRARIDAALHHLAAARGRYESLDDQDVPAVLSAIELERLRLTDVLGDHEGALSGLRALEHQPYWRPEPLLVASCLAYELACLLKLADSNEKYLGEYRGLGHFVAKKRKKLIGFPPDRSCMWMSIGGGFMLAEDRLADAVDCFRRGLDRQESVKARQLRPLHPQDAEMGMRAFNLCGQLQQALLAHPWPKKPTPGQPQRQAFLAAEDAKGRYFRQGLGFARMAATDEADAQRRRAFLARALRDVRYDARIVSADLAWLDVTAGRRTLEQQEPGQDLTPRLSEVDLESLFSRLPQNTVLVSLYTMRHGTYLYLADCPDRLRNAAVLPTPQASVKRAGDLLRSHFSPHPYHPHVVAERPHLFHERYLGATDALAEELAPLAEFLAGYDHAVLLPHGPWHALPLHAMLLPGIWAAGGRTALTYAPSLGVLAALVARHADTELTRRAAIGVLTVPHRGNDLTQFEGLHDELRSSLDSSQRPMIADFGAEATADTLLSLLTWVGVQHVLAHGLTDPGNPLQSGLMMGADGRLPPDKATPRTTPFLPGFVSAAELAAEAIVADHVTVQACSLGLAVPGAGEEFWGVTRSLLLGGASTVIAPLWDVSPASSTALLADFYRRWLGAGQPRWQAWAEAQREMYTSSPQAWQHYYHWAPFRLVGVP